MPRPCISRSPLHVAVQFGHRLPLARAVQLACALLLLATVAACHTGQGAGAAPPTTTAAGKPTAIGNLSSDSQLSATDSQSTATVILLSFDGFRWDYDGKTPTPNLQRVIARGVRAERLIPAFPSKTFPNHYTTVTGLYPEHHGIVGNTMWDPQMQAAFEMSDKAAVGDSRWWGGEPIWVTAQRQGLVAAVLFWPGSEAEIGGIRPRYWKPFAQPLPSNDERVDQLLAWLDLPAADRPSLLLSYFSDTDQAGHSHGPDSPEVQAAITQIDHVIGRLTAGLESRGLLDRVNLVFTSDHGMAATSPDRVIVLSDYLDPATVRITDINPTLGLIPIAPTTADDVLKKLRTAHPHLRVYRKNETPAHWHYRNNPRIPPIVGVADDGWSVIRERPKDPTRKPGIGGAHGYDPKNTSMGALFVAAGPEFRRGVTLPPFENIHIYNALCAALHIQPARNDGNPRLAQQMLAPVARPAGPTAPATNLHKTQ